MKIRFITLLSTLMIGFAATSAESAATNPRTGEAVFNSACATCHATHFPNAPQAHDTKAWQKKYAISAAQAKRQDPTLSGKALDEKTLAVLVSKVRNGNHTMPPKGLCNDCSDQEYQDAIKFMSTDKGR